MKVATARQLAVTDPLELRQLWREAVVAMVAIGNPVDAAIVGACNTAAAYALLCEELAVTEGRLQPLPEAQ